MPKTPFLLIPGLNADDRVFANAITALWPFGSVIVANHLEGEGVEGMARDILAAAPPTFALAGFSMGGYVAFEVLRQARERVAKLALIDTSARPDTPEGSENRRKRIEQVEGGKFGLVVQQSFGGSVHPAHKEDAALLAIHTAMSMANGPEVYVRQQQAIIGRPDSRSELGLVNVQTLIVVGEGDAITPPEVAHEMHAGIAGSELAVIPDAGHLALLEQPDQVNAALRQWAAR